jgi:hypothetical protein
MSLSHVNPDRLPGPEAADDAFSTELDDWQMRYDTSRRWITLSRDFGRDVRNSIGFPASELATVSALLTTARDWSE